MAREVIGLREESIDVFVNSHITQLPSKSLLVSIAFCCSQQKPLFFFFFLQWVVINSERYHCTLLL